MIKSGFGLGLFLLSLTTVFIIDKPAYAQQSDPVEVAPRDAQEKSQNEPGSNESDETAEEIIAEPEPAPQPAINPDAIFTPTEEISEDKPVAFPVDI